MKKLSKYVSYRDGRIRAIIIVDGKKQTIEFSSRAELSDFLSKE